jgi:hypothetical protein
MNAGTNDASLASLAATVMVDEPEYQHDARFGEPTLVASILMLRRHCTRPQAEAAVIEALRRVSV